MSTLDERRRAVRVTLSDVIEGEACGPLSIEALEVYEPFPPWQPAFLERRARCYAQAGHAFAWQAAKDWRSHQEAAGSRSLNFLDQL